jgi:iron complex transport system substrate-binding protein
MGHKCLRGRVGLRSCPAAISAGIPRISLVAALALIVVTIAGCGPSKAQTGANGAGAGVQKPWSQLTILANPRDYVGPTTARLANDNITPITTDPEPVLPATVKDHQGTTVTVRSDARILALDLYGSLAATVYGLGLGDKLVGRDTSTGFPAAAHLPLITKNGHQLSAEAILALHPTVLITDTTLGPWDVVLQIRAAGVPVVIVDSKRTLDTVDTLVGSVSEALGVSAEGKQLNARLDNEITAERAQIAKVIPADVAKRPRIMFLYARGQAGVYYLFGKGSGTDTLIRALGGMDVATEADIEGFTPLNAEALAKTRPDVILMMTAGLESVGGVDGALKLPGVAQTPAGRHRRIVDMSDYQVLSFGPLTASVLDGLARAIYAPDATSSAAK